jgi:hypothetical protein
VRRTETNGDLSVKGGDEKGLHVSASCHLRARRVKAVALFLLQDEITHPNDEGDLRAAVA